MCYRYHLYAHIQCGQLEKLYSYLDGGRSYGSRFFLKSVISK